MSDGSTRSVHWSFWVWATGASVISQFGGALGALRLLLRKAAATNEIESVIERFSTVRWS